MGSHYGGPLWGLTVILWQWGRCCWMNHGFVAPFRGGWGGGGSLGPPLLLGFRMALLSHGGLGEKVERSEGGVIGDWGDMGSGLGLGVGLGGDMGSGLGLGCMGLGGDLWDWGWDEIYGILGEIWDWGEIWDCGERYGIGGDMGSGLGLGVGLG